jgi:dihydrofolate reductase
MRKVIVQMSISLDGFVAPASGDEDHGAAPEAPALKQVKLDWLRQVGTHAMGRVTYEEMADHWPASTDAYAAPMNELPKVVLSKTLEKAGWNDSRVARGDLAAEIASLKAEPGGDIIAWGGRGRPLFKDLPAPLRLRSIEATTYESGAALHVYRPVAS